MGKYRKKPVIIEAFQLPGSEEEASDELVEFLNEMNRDWEQSRDGGIVIHTLEGDMKADPKDWIIKGISGEHYPCKPDIFELTYELVE